MGRAPALADHRGFWWRGDDWRRRRQRPRREKEPIGGWGHERGRGGGEGRGLPPIRALESAPLPAIVGGKLHSLKEVAALGGRVEDESTAHGRRARCNACLHTAPAEQVDPLLQRGAADARGGEGVVGGGRVLHTTIRGFDRGWRHSRRRRRRQRGGGGRRRRGRRRGRRGRGGGEGFGEGGGGGTGGEGGPAGAHVPHPLQAAKVQRVAIGEG